MVTKIGPTFSDELRAAGCVDGIAWDPETGELFGEDTSAAQKVLDAHDPAKLPLVTLLQRKVIVSNLHDMNLLDAFMASKCKASDLERWQSYDDVPIDNPVMLRIFGKASPVIDAVAVFNYTG